jgi:hypothetical protein
MTENQKLNRGIMLIILILFCSMHLVHAAVAGQVSYQGMLTDDAGTPLDGTYAMRLYLYGTIIGGTSLWDEQQSVVVTDGVYNVQLGAVNPLDSSDFSGDEIYLEVAIYNATTTTWETLSPRQQITSTAYAFQAENAQFLEGHRSADFAPDVHQHSGNDITSGIVDETRIDSIIARDSEITWSNLSGIPADIADGDQVGITTETDPTITEPSIKDGVSWGELNDIPDGFEDGEDNIGLASETDPQVGSNTTNYVPKWNGSALVSGSLYDNGNIGVGTTTPGKKLEVNSGNDSVNSRFTSNSVASAIAFHNSDVSIDSVMVGAQGTDLRLMTAGNDRVAIKNDGKVGIGTTNPGNYDVAADDLVVYRSGNSGITLATGDANSITSIYFADGTSGADTYRGFIQYRHGTLGERLRFGSNGSEIMSLFNQNVGIGATYPVEKLQVNGTIRATGYQSGDGSPGITTTIAVLGALGIPCTITVEDGLITGTNCPND